MNVGAVGIAMFLAVLLLTLIITYLSARKVRGISDFLSAGGQISGPLNGLAISGDFLSATTMLGITALFFTVGFDAAIYLISPMIGMLIMLGVLAGPIRKFGKYTVADILASRFEARPMRILSAVNTLTISIFYLVVQMVGAGALVETIFGLPYAMAVAVIGVLMTVYVAFGGMVATTWVQIVKAVLLIVGISILSVASLAQFGFNYAALSEAASAAAGAAKLFGPGAVTTDLSSSLSLSTGLILGMCGLPHILIRLYTVPSEKAARVSVATAMLIIAFAFLAILLIIGPAAIALLTGNPDINNAQGAIIGGGNMIVLHLSSMVGGEYLLGFVGAVVLATILAVVAGLTIASVGALSYDLFGQVFNVHTSNGYNELKASRISSLFVGAVAIALGVAFESQNLAYLVSLVFAIAASANFPILIMALYSKRATTQSVLAVGVVGLVTSIGLVILGPAVWVDVLGFEKAIAEIRYPALWSVAVSGFTAFVLLVMAPSRNNA
jgi:cation/acetate symporter